MPIILATWEAETRRIMVPGQPRQKKVCKTLISTEESWEQWHIPGIQAIMIQSMPAWAKSLSPK
jgi:hypothetical protein